MLLALAAVGCGVRAPAYPYYRPFIEHEEPPIAFHAPPKLVEIEPGLYVVHDHVAPIYFVDGDYWRYDLGVWYRAKAWNQVWQPVHFSLVPERIAHRDHARYVRYRSEDEVVRGAPR